MDQRVKADERRPLYRYRFGTVEFDEARFELRVSGLAVEIQRKPLEVLAILLARTDEVITKDYLLDTVWDGRPTVDAVVANAIMKIRSALGDENANRIVTQARAGYRLTGPVERVAVGRNLQSTLELREGGQVPHRENFKLLALIGASSNSEVWLARHRKTGESRVYKFTPHGEQLSALKREVTLYRVLRDSLGERADFVKVLDWNFEESPFYLELEYGGRNLIDWATAEGRLQALSSDARVDMFLQIADAVAAAHSVGVLHKDLKPTNVLVAPKDGGWQIKVSDFGSGSLLDLDRLDELSITRLGLTMNGSVGLESRATTALYAAPEVIAGSQPTIQSDVYPLGLILYQLLSGDLRKPMVSGWERDIPDAELREDIAKATDGDLEERLPSAAILAERLRSRSERRLARQFHTQAQQVAAALQDELKRSRARRPWIMALIASLVIGLATSLVFFVRDRAARIEALQQAAETRTAQSRLLTEAAARRLEDGDVAGAEGIILEVLTNPGFAAGHAPAAINVFQEARALDAELAVLAGHTDVVESAAFSPDGSRIVTASYDGSARIWDAQTGAPLAVLSGHRAAVRSAAYSPDGSHIVTASQDMTARIWDARSGGQSSVLIGHGDFVYGASYSPDGTRIVTASRDKTARIWDARTGAQLVVLSGHSEFVYGASYSPDGTRIVTASRDGTARIWDARTGKELAVLAGHGSTVWSALYSPDGTRIVTASADKTARIWDARAGTPLAVLAGHRDKVEFAAFSPDGTRIVTASEDKTVRLWDSSTGTQVAVLGMHADAVECASYSADGTRIVTAGADKTARIWSTRSGMQLAVLAAHRDVVEYAAYSPDGTRIVTVSDDKSARIWDARRGVALAELSGHGKPVVYAAYSPDGARIVTASFDRTARIWDARSNATLAVLTGHENAILSAAYSPDGARIVTASQDRTARIWDSHTARQLAVLSGHGDRVRFAAYSPDGTRIVTASVDKTVRLWDARTAAQLTVLGIHGDVVNSAAYSPDGTRIVTASDDKTARIWDARTATEVASLSGHGDRVLFAAYSPDGTRIVTASSDKTARIWDARSGSQLAVLSGHGDIVEAATFSPDGATIVTASDDKTARIWNGQAPAALDAQIAWDSAAQTDALSATDRTDLGLPAQLGARAWPSSGSACDRAAAAYFDPDRQAPGTAQSGVNPDIANSACAADAAEPGHAVRFDYQWGRALWAKHDVAGARRRFELAVAKGYRAAGVDLGKLLTDPSAGMLDPARAVALYQEAWRAGVPSAAFALGQLYETGLPGDAGKFPIDMAQAWAWYQKGAQAGEPAALARFGEREEDDARADQDPASADARLLAAFRYYAAAAAGAQWENWPDEAWRNWRYRRATLARLLAREGMMSQVAEAYSAVRRRYGS